MSIPAGTRFQYTISWTASGWANVLDMTSGTVTQGLQSYLQDDGIVIEDTSNAWFGHSLTIKGRLQYEYSDLQSIQDTLDGNIASLLGDNGTITSSSIDNYILPGAGTPTPTGSPNSGWGAGGQDPSTCTLLDKLNPSNSVCKTSILPKAGIGTAIFAIVVLFILLIYFAPAAGVHAARTLRG